MELIAQFALLTGFGSVIAALVSLLFAPSPEEIARVLAERQAAVQQQMWARFAEDIARAEHADADRREALRDLRADLDGRAIGQMPPLVAEPLGDIPPMHLYHGTARNSFGSILLRGLVPGRQPRVYLAADIQTARTFGRQRGDYLILRISANEACQRGTVFQAGAAGTFTCDRVDPAFIDTEWTIQEYTARRVRRAA